MNLRAGIIAIALTLSFLGGMATEHARVAEWLPNKRIEPNGTHVYGWPGPSGMREDYSDQDNDGQWEQWTINTWGRQPYGMSYTLFDDNDDGEPEDFMALFGDINSMANLIKYSDARVTWIVLLPHIDGERVMYSDLNGDAIFDNRYRSEGETHEIQLDNVWRISQNYVAAEGDQLYDACELVMDGANQRYEFRDDKWRRVSADIID